MNSRTIRVIASHVGRGDVSAAALIICKVIRNLLIGKCELNDLAVEYSRIQHNFFAYELSLTHIGSEKFQVHEVVFGIEAADMGIAPILDRYVLNFYLLLEF